MTQTSSSNVGCSNVGILFFSQQPRSWFSFGGTPKSTPPPTRLVFGQSVGTPGSPGVATPTWDVEKDTDTLFRLHGIEEIKQIEKQTRLDIDSRREGLRQMVG